MNTLDSKIDAAERAVIAAAEARFDSSEPASEALFEAVAQLRELRRQKAALEANHASE